MTVRFLGVFMVSEKVKSALKDLGLTEYETRAYVGLVSTGPSTAGDLSEVSDVPHSRIYDVLSKLENRGWIESQSGRPARYRAKSPSETLSLVKLKKEEEIKRASETIKQELEPLYEEEGEVEKPDVWTIRGSKEILGRIKEMLNDAEMEVLITLPPVVAGFEDLREYVPLLDTKDLDVRVLASEKNDLSRKLDSVSNIEIRFRGSLFGGGVIVDGREVLLVLGREGRILGIWSEEIGLAKFAQEYFEYLWSDLESTS